MKNKTLYLIWGGLFILCGLLGFIPEPQGFLKLLMTALGILFFVPGMILLYRAKSRKEAAAARVVRGLSVTSLSVTLLLLVMNLLSGHAPQAAGEMLYGLLVIFSAPMVCSQYWVASLFLWACLLMGSFSVLGKLKKG